MQGPLFWDLAKSAIGETTLQYQIHRFPELHNVRRARFCVACVAYVTLLHEAICSLRCIVIRYLGGHVKKSLELHRLVTDLFWCYAIVFGHIDVDIGDSLRSVSRTRGHD